MLDESQFAASAPHPGSTTPLDGLPFKTRGIVRGSLRRTLGVGLMCIVVFEASLFGSGQMLHVGGPTMKMILFMLSVLYTAISLLCGDRISISSSVLIAFLFLSLAIASLLGLVHGADLKLIAEDISPQLGFLLLPFFELTMRTKQKVVLATNIILMCVMVMCAGYVAMLGALWLGKISAEDLYLLLLKISNGDFMYDAQTWRVFYKGSLYIGVGVLLFAFRRGRWSKVGMCISFIVLLLTVTRGFLLALLAVMLLYALIGPARSAAKLAYAILILGFGSLALYAAFGLIGDKTESNTDRIITMEQVADRVTWGSVLVGHGFGVGVPERPEHMEIAYLEMFHKQGLVGFAWLGCFGAVLTLRFRKALRLGDKNLAYSLFLLVAFVAIESLTNPYINNPIGMSVLIVSMTGLKVLADPPTDLERKDVVFG